MKKAFGVALLLHSLLLSAHGWTLTGGDTRWEIDERTGAIRTGVSASSVEAIRRCRDVYEVVYATRVEVQDESLCRVLSSKTSGLPTSLTLRCELPELGLSIEKRYRIDERTGWLMKQTSIVAPELEKGFFHLLSSVGVSSSMWRGSYLYHPIWNSGGSPMIRAEDIAERHNLRAADGTGLMTLSNPGHALVIGHVRYAVSGTPEFFDHCIGIRGIGKDIIPGVETRQTDTVVRPGKWTMSCVHGAVGNGVTKPVSVEVGYALMNGDLYDFQLVYKAIPPIRDILHYDALNTPPWVRNQLIDVWTDYTVDNGTTGRAFAKLFQRMWFGNVTMVVFGYYEDTYSYPGDDEQWEEHWNTVLDKPFYHEDFKTGKQRGKSPEEYIVRYGDAERAEGVLVARCRWKPSEQRAAIRKILEASGNSPRLKVAVYTHMGTSGLDRESVIVRKHPELITRRANGRPYRHRTDYNMNDNYPVGILMQGADPIMQNWWVDTLERQLDYFDRDITYFDVLFRSSVKVDWNHHRAVQNQEMYPQYRRFVEVAHDRGAALFTNYAVPVFNDMGYTEQAGFPTYRKDWYGYAARISGQQVLNRPGRPLIVVNTPHAFESPFPPDSLHADCVSYVLNTPLLHNARMSLHPASQNDPERQERFASKALPWLQAFFELRLREYVNPHVSPRWWAEETQLESHGYRLDKMSGVVAFMNHGKPSGPERVSFQTAPLGLQPGKPAWMWRLQMPHPQDADDSTPGDDAPIPRLASQTQVAFYEALPEILAYEESWPVETPVLLMITHSPALIRSVGGRTCQFFLAEAFGARIKGSLERKSGRIDLTVFNYENDIELLVPGRPGTMPLRAQMHQVGTTHPGTDVLPAAREAEVEPVEIDGQTYLQLRSPRGSTEFVVR